jgi:hypothetical protein
VKFSHANGRCFEEEMSKPVTHKKISAASRSHRSNGTPRYARASVRISMEPREKKARSAWVAAMGARKAVQARIAAAYGRYLDGSGPGPTDEELLNFARLAIAEQRLERRLRWSPPILPSRGEQP